MVGRERLGKLTWELKFLELQTFSKCKIIFIDSTCGFLALFSSHSGACSCLTIMFLNFVLSQHRTKTEQGPNSAWNLISLPENAQCLVQWFEQQWSGKDTLQSVELKTVWLPVGRRKQRKMMESGTRTRAEKGNSFPPSLLFPFPPSLPLSFPYSFFFSPLLCHWAIMDGNYGWLVNSKHHLLCISPLFNYRLAKEWISSAVLEGSCAQRTLLSFRTSRCKLI